MRKPEAALERLPVPLSERFLEGETASQLNETGATNRTTGGSHSCSDRSSLGLRELTKACIVHVSNGIGIVRVVEDVEEVRTERKAHTLCNGKALQDRDVPVLQTRASVFVSRLLTDNTRSGASDEASRIEGRSMIAIVLRNAIGTSGVDVGTSIALARITDVELVEPVGVGTTLFHGEGRSSLQGCDAGYLPSAEDLAVDAVTPAQ